MGVGKSTVGALLANLSGRPFVDLDHWIERSTKLGILEIFESEGEAGFRKYESAAIAALHTYPAAIVALGGGAVIDPHNRQRIRALGHLITLTAQPETLFERLSGGTHRPLAKGGDLLERLAARASAYADADGSVATDGRTPNEIAAVLLREWLS